MHNENMEEIKSISMQNVTFSYLVETDREKQH